MREYQPTMLQDKPRIHRVRVIGILQELVNEMSLIRVFFDNAFLDSAHGGLFKQVGTF